MPLNQGTRAGERGGMNCPIVQGWLPFCDPGEPEDRITMTIVLGIAKAGSKACDLS